MSKNALRYPESAIAGGVFGTARVRGMVADTAARLTSEDAVALEPTIARLISSTPAAVAATPLQRMQALGRLPAGRMNKTEAAYAELLAARVHVGEILEFKFESVKLRLADRTWYTPDFALVLADGTREIHEVKGHWTDDARVKIKVAAELYPYDRFIAVRRVKGEWIREVF
ncbi:hypothetical protein [Burkholderia lata]|uniref:DUF1064 domain-containing protein n=1 Tax=Burkholderia lata (strain ATCC 17760 / DSM 23089 / LMG 22485 / NCIMB 9086 / R18194 / 383) TaxID=482957 RepID=A0A6P2LFQ1_BURL3|nr:hypothetical protein [Burkholderia lata]VWB70187.1 hypothetical protein BLA6863_03290 [Burkholderia lata]